MLGKVAGGLLVGFILYYLIRGSYWQGYCNGYKCGYNDAADIGRAEGVELLELL